MCTHLEPFGGTETHASFKLIVLDVFFLSILSIFLVFLTLLLSECSTSVNMNFLLLSAT